jgi:hypothetical protein
MQTEKHKWKHHEARVRKRDTGAEQPVVAIISWKQEVAKGLWQGAAEVGQPEVGGTDECGKTNQYFQTGGI